MHNTNYLSYHSLDHYTASILTNYSIVGLVSRHRRNCHQLCRFNSWILLICSGDPCLCSYVSILRSSVCLCWIWIFIGWSLKTILHREWKYSCLSSLLLHSTVRNAVWSSALSSYQSQDYKLKSMQAYLFRHSPQIHRFCLRRQSQQRHT